MQESSVEIIEKLNNDYFDLLESQGVQYLSYDGEVRVKDEYILSNDDMARELDYKDFADYCRKYLANERAEMEETTQPQVMTPETKKEPEKVQKSAEVSAIVADANDQLNANARTTDTSFMNPVVFQQMKLMANTMITSKALPSYIQNAAQVMVVFQAGWEMGLKPFESLQDLYILKGNVNFFGKSVGKQLRKHGWIIEQYQEVAPDSKQGGSCTATVTKKETGEKYSDIMTFEEAVASGATVDSDGKLKPNWALGKNRTLKLRYNALDKIIRSYILEVYGVAQGIVEVNEDFDTASATEAELTVEVDQQIAAEIESATDVKSLIVVGRNLRSAGKFTKEVQGLYNQKRNSLEMGDK